MTMMSVVSVYCSLARFLCKQIFRAIQQQTSGMLDCFGLWYKNAVSRKGAIGFDWVAISKGGVPWLISWPR
jgi:hypothetical protein